MIEKNMNLLRLCTILKNKVNPLLNRISKQTMHKQTSQSFHCKTHAQVPLQVSITSSVILNEAHPSKNTDGNEHFQCIRCGTVMEKSKSVLINIQPPVFHSKKNYSSMSIEVLSKNNDSNTSLESVTEISRVECCLPNPLDVSETSETETGYPDIECTSQDESSASNSTIFKSDESASADVSVVGSQQSITPCTHFLHPPVSSIDFSEGLVSHPCTDCHVAVLNQSAAQEISGSEYISLMLQVVHLSPPIKSVECQTDEAAFRSEVGLAVNILEIYPKINSKCGPSEGSSVSGSKQNPQRNLPELDAEAEAAYRCHLKNLVPCSHCGRTFNPDRVMVHENACVERPRERKRRKRK